MAGPPSTVDSESDNGSCLSDPELELMVPDYKRSRRPKSRAMSLPEDVKMTTNPVGSKASPMDFYPTKPGTSDSAWTVEYPTWLSEAIENPETAEYAIIRRHAKSTDTRRKLCLHSIVVQSPLIKKVLEGVFENYEGVTTTLARLEFLSPFKPFVHRWEKFRDAREQEKNEETRKHIDVLWETLEEDLKSTLDEKNDLIANGVITFELLWTMFEPGTLIFVQMEQQERVMIVDSHWYERGVFNLSAKFVEWDGTKFGTQNDQNAFQKFDGTTQIVGLPAYPLAYHPDPEGVQRRCIVRGKTWEGFCKYSFMAYKGIGVTVRRNRCTVDSRVILDTAAFNSLNPDYRIYAYSLPGGHDYIAPAGIDVPEEHKGVLSSYQLLLATSKLRGYSLKDKQWLVMDLDGLSDILWNDTAFSRLILPNDTKDLVLAFAQSQIQTESTFDDVIEGKGKGIIMLLSGPPGVGKTLTAEAVAETMRVPLYMMSAGDLGTDPNGVEVALKSILLMTTKWKAVLLLDEADVFLEARSTHDLERNKLVSIFLRTLEYYEGFLFLTSNRVDNIDGAFESRIHLCLQYEALTVESRRHVWTKFLEGMGRSDGFTGDQIDTLAQMELNGRQIKNILKTSQLLATSKKRPLNFEDVQILTKLRAANACIPTDRF